MLYRIKSSIVAAFVVLAFADASRAQCPDWKTGFARPGTNDVVTGLFSFDDGSGPALFVGGEFMTAGSVRAQKCARWRDLEWSTAKNAACVGSSYAVFDSGSGPQLHAAGASWFFDGFDLARWDGSSWVALFGQQVSGLNAIAVFDDGSGPALYATGSFATIAGVAANRIAKWDGTSWSPLGSGLKGAVSPAGYSLAVHDDGTGNALYVGGRFDTADGIPANGIARWQNGAWSALGTGMSGGAVRTLHSGIVGPSGTPLLYAAGEFTSAGGTAANRIASWNGSSWSALGSGLDGYARDLELYDDGAGAKLYAAGGFHHAGGAPAHCIARWDGTTWSALTSDVGPSFIQSLAVHDDGTGPALFAGGDFRTIGSTYMWNVAKWTGTSWHPLGRGRGLDGPVNALATFDSALYAGGDFAIGDGVELHGIGRLNSMTWSPLGDGLNGTVSALSVYDDGTGAGLYAGGSFTSTSSGGTQLSGIGRWNGSTWSALGTGVGGNVRAMTVFDDGHGPALYAGGSFPFAGLLNVKNVARWDGSAWTSIGGVNGGGVDALAVFDDGTGRALYVGGSFSVAGTTPAKNIAKWDGQTWSALGTGMNGRVFALKVFDDGSGPALYAGGRFTTAGGSSALRVARWDGASWSAVGGGFSDVSSEVHALGVFEDGAGVGPVLVAGGHFDLGNGRCLARLHGSSWKVLGGGVDWSSSLDPVFVNAFAVFDDGSSAGPELYLGGDFQTTGSHASLFIARMGCASTKVPFCFGTQQLCPCGNWDSFGDPTGCMNSTSTGLSGGGRLDGAGTVSLANDGFVLSAKQISSATALYLQGTATIASGAGTTLGDGILCAGGAIIRLKTKSAPLGLSSYPSGGDLPISTTGLVTTPGMRVYQVMYRDQVGECTSPNTFNFTNAVQVGWAP